MGTLLKVLNVFILLFAVLAFVMAVANFNKREELIGRTDNLEKTVIALGTTLEAAPPTFDGVANHTAWDVDEVTERPSDAPTTDDFWDSYQDVLELSSTDVVNLNKKKEQLATLYKIDPGTGKPEKDFNGRKKTEGRGTMREVLDETIQRAKDQYALLNRTRQQLIAVREKLDDVAGMLNEEKQQRRANLATIAQLNATIEALNKTIAEKDNQIAQLNREKADLEDQIADLRSEIDRKDQDLASKDTEIARLKEELERVTVDNGSGAGNKRGVSGAASDAPAALTAGVKGVVRQIESEWGFVIIELTPEAVAEILPGGSFSPVEMMVRRKAPDGSDTIVTRVQITNPPNARNMAVADNMYGWEQVPVQVGDEVVY